MATVIEGCPAGLKITTDALEAELARRRRGYGRGGRMSIEGDRVEILSGVRHGRSLGSPITLWVENRDHANWLEAMGAEEPGEGADLRRVTAPRPGHADLAGAVKYGAADLRDILERASARETVGRVCAGSVARLLLGCLGVTVISHVLSIGGVESRPGTAPGPSDRDLVDSDDLRCLDAEASSRMKERIDSAAGDGDTLGGVVEVLAYGVPPGLGSHAHWDRRLDGLLAQAVMSIQSCKGVEVGEGFSLAAARGSSVLDLVARGGDRGYHRLANHAGGIEGGISNGEAVVLRAAFKPIPTLGRPAPTVDIASRESVEAQAERSDVCAVPAAGVVAESMVAWTLACALLEKTGGDRMDEVEARFRDWLEEAGSF
jgi:chorismate synthase